MKGIILAGGSGTRLNPLTSTLTKQILPVYNKPMIYYPLSTLIRLGVTDIAVITTDHQQHQIKDLLENGSKFGVDITYFKQWLPEGLAQAFIICEDWLDEKPCVMILGDNIFTQCPPMFDLLDGQAGCVVTKVLEPRRYGVMNYDKNLIVEKPEIPPSSDAVTGVYFLDGHASRLSNSLEKSARGELEITSLLNCYAFHGGLKVKRQPTGSWFDAGTFDSLLEVSQFVCSSEKRTGTLIGDPFIGLPDPKSIR